MREYADTWGLVNEGARLGWERISSAAASLDRWAEAALVSFEDLIIDDFSAVSAYVDRRFLAFVYKFSLVYVCASYAFLLPQHSLSGDILFAVAFFYLLAKILFFLPNCSVYCLKLWACADALAGFFVNLMVNFSNRLEYSLTAFCLMTATGFFSPSLSVNVLLAIFTSVANALVASAQGTARCPIVHTMELLLPYTLLVCVLQVYNITLEEATKRFRQARQKAEEEIVGKTLFVASISHDLKNPLGSLLGFIDLLRGSKSLTRADRKNLRTASYSGQILKYLIENILDSAKIETGKFDLQRAPMDIAAEIMKVTKIEQELTREKNIKLYRKVLTPLPRQVFGDPMRFAQVLINLVGNSIKFTSKGYVAVLAQWVDRAEEVEDCSSKEQLIPGEEFFAQPQPLVKKSCTDNTTAVRSTGLPLGSSHIPTYLRNPFEEFGEDVGEEMQGSVHERIRKYNVYCRGGKPIFPSVHPRFPKSSDSISISASYRGVGGYDNPAQVRRHPFHDGTFKTEVSPAVAMARDSGTNQSADFAVTMPVELNRLRKEIVDDGVDAEEEEEEEEKEQQSSEKDEEDSDRDSPFLEQKEEREFGDSGILVLDVIDTGIGMTPEEVGKLFQPFTQANRGVKSQYGGSGLGLWITRQIVHRMSGFVTIHSQSQKGTRFRLTFPFKLANSNTARSGKSAEDDKEGLMRDHTAAPRIVLDLRSSGRLRFRGNKNLLRTTRILLLEDGLHPEDAAVEQITSQLRPTGCELFYATHDQARRILGEQKCAFDAAIVVATAADARGFIEGISRAAEEARVDPIPCAVISGMIGAILSRW